MNLHLDASTTSIGWCEADEGYHDSGVYKPRGRDVWARIENAGHWLRGRLMEKPYRRVVYELATGRHGNVSVDRKLGALEYAARLACRAHFVDVEFDTVTASQVRASGCHKRALPVATSLAGRPVTSGDEADAIGVWRADVHKRGWEECI